MLPSDRYTAHSILLVTYETPGWADAVMQDDGRFVSKYAMAFPNREDTAESYTAWFAVRYRSDRVSRALTSWIERTIPGRLAYFDVRLAAGDGSFAPGMCPVVEADCPAGNAPRTDSRRLRTPGGRQHRASHRGSTCAVSASAQCVPLDSAGAAPSASLVHHPLRERRHAHAVQQRTLQRHRRQSPARRAAVGLSDRRGSTFKRQDSTGRRQQVVGAGAARRAAERA